MPQFTDQRSRPLSSRHYAAAVRRARELIDAIERNSSAVEPRDKAKLTQAIHNLAMHARRLSERHRRQLRESIGERQPMAMLPNDYHPSWRCSCRDCICNYPQP